MLKLNTEYSKINNKVLCSITARTYWPLILLSSFLSFGLSLTLSLIFWWSIGNRLTESILFVMFALVFELCKFISLPLAIKHYAQREIFCLNLAIYLLLTVLSVLSSIGGIGSCFSNNQAQAIQSSGEYQSITRQIESEQTLITSELATVQADLTHNYRTQAQTLMGHEIPQQQKILNQLREQRENVHGTALSPSLSLLKIFSDSFSISSDRLENLFVAMIAVLIEVISTYLIIISMIGNNTHQNRSFSSPETFSERPKILHKPSIIKPCEEKLEELKNTSSHVMETSQNQPSHSKSFLEKCEQVRRNIENNVHGANITHIMAHEKIGYPKAKEILHMLLDRDSSTISERCPE